jgi:hypothetical protein
LVHPLLWRAAREAAREAQAAQKAAACDAPRVGHLTAEQAMEAAALAGLELKPAGNETGFSCVYRTQGN